MNRLWSCIFRLEDRNIFSQWALWCSHYFRGNKTDQFSEQRLKFDYCFCCWCHSLDKWRTWLMLFDSKLLLMLVQLGLSRPLFIKVFSSFQYTWQRADVNICQWLDSNRRPLVLEETALPTESQLLLSLCYNCCCYRIRCLRRQSMKYSLLFIMSTSCLRLTIFLT